MPTSKVCTAAVLLLLHPALPAQTVAVDRPREEPAPACAPAGRNYTRTTLYFGLARPAGTITEKQWKVFVRDEITPRFPQGFTVWEGTDSGEAPMAASAVNAPKCCCWFTGDSKAARDALVGLVEIYKRTFQQESVLWETASVCAAF